MVLQKLLISLLLSNLMQTHNARKACPPAIPHPDWVFKSKEIGNLPTLLCYNFTWYFSNCDKLLNDRQWADPASIIII
jgi:hypothetical protein